MRINLHNRLSYILLAAFLLTSAGVKAAGELVLNASAGNRLTVIESNTSRLQVEVTLSTLNTLLLNTEKGEFTELMASGYSKTNLPGAPELPVLSRLIEVPAGAQASVRVLSREVTEYRLSDFGISTKLFPAQFPQTKSGLKKEPFAWNEELYRTDRFYGEEPARVELSGYLRGIQLASLVIAPVEYNPATNTLRVSTHIVVEITFSGADLPAMARLKAKTRSAYFSSMYAKVLNPMDTDAPTDTLSKFPVSYVIVSDPMFHDALQPFIHWKTKKGFRVTEAYTDNAAVGNTFNSIKAFLQSLYTGATASDPAPTFVLFVGDVDQIPSYNCGAHVSDLYYCEYTCDYLPDVYYGRFSANNVSELLPQINKTLQYEQYLMPDPSYLNEVVMAAGADATHQLTWGNGQINYGTQYYFNEAHNLLSHTYLQPEPAGANYSQNIQTNVSTGVSYANYTAHGSPDGWADPSFTIANVASLQNADKYCLMVGNCCQTNTFNENTFGEALLRAENKGALGYIGATDFSYWDEDYWWGVGNGPVVSDPTYETTGLGAYDRTFHDHGEPRTEWYSTQDQMIFAGNLAVEESNSGMKQYYWEVYCLMGDPSLMVYFSVPPALTVTDTPLLPLGTPEFQIQTEPYAYVAISKNGILHGVAEAGEDGMASVPLLPFTEPGFADIVITKQNRQPYIDSVMVASPAGPYLVMSSCQANDDGGNNNQIPEFGESLTVDMGMQNYGNSDAVNAVSTLSTSDPYVSLPVNTYTWPLIASNNGASATDVFTLKGNAFIPDQHTAEFTITTQADTSVFTSGFSLLFSAPELSNSLIMLDDAAGGNGNGQIDPGETVAVTMNVTNTGHCTSGNVSVQLFLFGNYVSSNPAPVSLGPLSSGASGNSTFSFAVAPEAVPGSGFSLFVTAEAGPYTCVSSLNLSIGGQTEDFETGNFTKFNWRMKGAKPWKISPVTRYEGNYSATSGVINNNQQSEMYIDGQVMASDTISFYRKVSSEEGYDFLRFYVDGNETGSWSGNQNWARVSYPVQAGTHRFSWTYEKDDATVSGQDAAWVDFIEFPPFSPTLAGPLSLITLADPPVICRGNESQLYVFAMGGTGTYSYSWSPAATLNYGSVFNPLASPTESTVYTVAVNSAFFNASSTVSVGVEAVPETPVISAAGDHLVSTPAEFYQWYNSQGLISGAASQSYYPLHTETYYVITSNTAGCVSQPSNPIVFGFTGIAGASAEAVLHAYPNPFTEHLTIGYSIPEAGPVRIVICNSIGQEIAVPENRTQSAGSYQLTINAGRLPSGVYYGKLYTRSGVQVIRIVKR
jgi:hypothetical protein